MNIQDCAGPTVKALMQLHTVYNYYTNSSKQAALLGLKNSLSWGFYIRTAQIQASDTSTYIQEPKTILPKKKEREDIRRPATLHNLHSDGDNKTLAKLLQYRKALSD